MRKKKEYKKICSWCGRAFTTNKIKRHFCYDCRPEQTATESHLDDNLSELSSYNNSNGTNLSYGQHMALKRVGKI
jgi:hypothetical protein